MNNKLRLYNTYTLNQLGEIFENKSFQYGGGMIYTVKHNTLVLLSKHTKDKIYQDSFKDGKIIYTGMGQIGDQEVILGNKRLVNAKRDNTDVHLFIAYKDNEYKYYGLVELNDPYYFDIEKDRIGNNRKVLKFPLTFKEAFAPMTEKELKQIIPYGNISQVRVVGACITDGDKYLVTKRSAQQGLEGKYEFPGGKVEKNESDKEALIREIYEELGVLIEVLDKVDDNSFFEPSNRRLINLNVYKSRIKKGLLAPKEGQSFEWKSLDELENLDWLKPDIDIVQTLIDSEPRKIVETIDYSYKQGEKRTPKPTDVKRECQDYEKSQKTKIKSGNEAEIAVIQYEIEKLKNIGRIDFANQIERVSLISPDFGYDIKSYELINGVLEEIHIEVKSAKYVSNRIEFFISQAEYRMYIEDPKYKIYALLKFGRNYKLHIVKRDEFLGDQRYISPISYKVSIPVEVF